MTATAHLSEVEEAIYGRMVDQYYAREAPLPLDLAACVRLVRASTAAARKAVPVILREFFTQMADGWHQKRCDEELATYHERSASAARSVSVRWAKRNTNVSETYAERNTNQKPVTSNHKPEVQEQAAAPPASKVRRRLPDGWAIPPAWAHWAATERPDWSPDDVLRVSLSFRDHWLGKGEARADWEATWRNWVRNERRMTSKPSSLAERRAANMDAITGRNRERTVDANAMGETPVREALSYVREQDDSDVGGLSRG